MRAPGRAWSLAALCAAAWLAAWLATWLALVAPAAAALDFPALTGRVVDEAGILDQATIAELTTKLADLEAKTTDQLVVVTLKSLRGTSIEDYGYQLGRQWKIGQKDKNNGALLIVAPADRKVRFEIGYGLEGTLTDAIGRFIIETSILPRFRANDFPGGIKRGVDDAILVLTGNASEWKDMAQTRFGRGASQPGDDIPWVPLIFVVVVIFIVLYSIVARENAAQARRGRGGGSPWVVGFPTGWSSSAWGGGGFAGGGGGGGFSGGGVSFGGGGASGSW